MKLLTIGNSFSDDSMEYVYPIAQSAGVGTICLGNLYIGGCTLNTHADNAENDRAAYAYRINDHGHWCSTDNYKMRDTIRSENWDCISLQQASGSSGIEQTYAKLPYMIEYVHRLCPGAKIVWNMTWAYQQDSSHEEFAKYNRDQMTMYAAILNAVETQVRPRQDISAIIPTGTAIQNARTSCIGDRLTRDGYHLSLDFGRYVAGLTFVRKLTGLSIEHVAFAPEGVGETMRRIAVESAVNAVQAPDRVSPSRYTADPAACTGR